MIAKLKIVEEELDESMYWLEMLVESGLADKAVLKPYYAEANELLAVVVASIKSLRDRGKRVSEGLAQYGLDGDDIFGDH